MIALLFLSLFTYPFLGILIRPITVFLHEFGHALPILFYDRKAQVEIFVGSYGDEDNSFSFQVGRLKVWICWRLFSHRGLCRSYAQLTINQRIIHIVCGPFASFVIVTVCFSLFVSDYSSFGSLLMGVFLISAIIDLISNLGKEVIYESEDGQQLYSDAYHLNYYLALRKAQSNS